MSVSQEFLERCAGESGFQIPALEKVVRLGELARNVAIHTTLSRTLVLKGGTALNLCFGPPRRLSVDLDYNYIGHRDRESMLEDRPLVERTVAELAKRSGYRVQLSADTFAGRKLFLVYRSVFGNEDRIEVDLNFLFRVPITRSEARLLWQPGDLDRPHVQVVGTEELLIGKLLALLDRGAARDAWDIAHLADPIIAIMGSETFRPLFITFAGTLDHPLPTYDRGRLGDMITGGSILERLAPVLVRGEGPGALEIVEAAWARVNPFLALSPDEAAYIESIHRGELRLDLLFPNDTAAAERLSEHPAIQWKLRNVRAHLTRGGC